MSPRRLLGLVAVNLRSSRASAFFAIVGIAVGIAFLTFFVGLGQGVRERVLNRIFPADQLEIEPRSVRVFGVEGKLGQPPLDRRRLAEVARIPGVVRVVGKQKSAFPARLWGGERLLGFNLRTEAFFDGLPANLLRPELEAFERRLRRRRLHRGGPPRRCDADLDCRPGERCDDGECATIVWSRFFDASLLHLGCETDRGCREGLVCRQGRCLAPSRAARPPRPCRLEHAEDQLDLLAPAARGHLLRPCSGKAGLCSTRARCPEPTYCAPRRRDGLEGVCEYPLPTVINPLLLEVFNSDMAASLKIPRMATTDILYGVRFHLALGASYFTEDAPRGRQQLRQAVIVGFSPKAPELGIALPLDFVRHQNARFVGRERAATFDALILQTASNEAVPAVIDAIEELGFSLSRRSRVARTFGTVVFLVYLALILTALVVLLVAAINIAHTFAMLVHERRREIAILRALGATRRAIGAMILGEALALGTAGALLGAAAALGGSRLVDTVAGSALASMPLVPHSFFSFPPWTLPAALGIAWLFCLAGALGPARRATALDPAAVLSRP